MSTALSTRLARLADSAPTVHLAAFGKHPGWDDHMEDQGLESDALVRAKRRFYTEGVGGALAAGLWEQIDPAKRLPGYGHMFLWRAGGSLMLGRLWASSDGRARSKHPMVLCAESTGVPLGLLLREGAPRLADLERDCRAAPGAAGVIAALDRARGALRATLGAAPVETPGVRPGADERRAAETQRFADSLRAAVSSPAWGEDGAGLRRVLYEFEREFEPYMPVTRARSAIGPPKAQHVRVPALAEDSEESLALWGDLLQSLLVADAEFLVLRPLEGAWVDLIVGPPEAENFACMLATPAAVPLASEIPYEFDEAFRARADARIATWRSGVPAASGARATGEPSPLREKRGLLVLLGIGLGVLGLILILAVALSGGGDEAPEGEPTTPAASGG